MLQNAYFLAKIRVDTAENEQHFAEILGKMLPVGRVDDRHEHRARRGLALLRRGGLVERDHVVRARCTSARARFRQSRFSLFLAPDGRQSQSTSPGTVLLKICLR